MAMIGSCGSKSCVACTIASALASHASATAVLSAPWGFMWCRCAFAALTNAYMTPIW